jgi:Ca2+-binding EF-hand superfamily protein
MARTFRISSQFLRPAVSMIDLGIASNPRKLIDHILVAEEPLGFRYDYVLLFMQQFGRTLEGDEEAAFKRRYNPENKETIPVERALTALLEFVQKDEIILMLETESKILDPKGQGSVHHAEDFRWMLKALGEEIPDNYINHFIREAMGRSDDLFDLNVYIENMCRTVLPEDPSKKKGKR